MAFTIVWSKQALEDLHDVVAFIARDNPEVAVGFGHRLISKIDMLSSFPEMGRVVPEKKDKKIREIIVRP